MTAPAWEPIGPVEIERDGEDEPRYIIIDEGDLPTERPPWVVEDVLYGSNVGTLVGEPEALKSFIALTLCACVASGLPFAGRRVTQGRALFVAAEGAFDLRNRLRAWRGANDVHGPLPLHFLDVPLLLTTDASVHDFLAAVTTREFPTPLSLLVLDTLSECGAGVDENATADMQLVMNRVRQISIALSCAVLLIHHLNASGLRERGSTTIRASSDAMWLAKRDGSRVEMACTKQRAAPRHQPILFDAQERPEDGSLALVDAHGGVSASLTLSRWQLLDALADAHRAGPFSNSRLKEMTRLATATLNRALSDLVARGYVDRLGTDHRPLYRCSEVGYRVRLSERSPDAHDENERIRNTRTHSLSLREAESESMSP